MCMDEAYARRGAPPTRFLRPDSQPPSRDDNGGAACAGGRLSLRMTGRCFRRRALNRAWARATTFRADAMHNVTRTLGAQRVVQYSGDMLIIRSADIDDAS